MRLKDSVHAGIEYSTHFLVWEAAVAAGATLDELQKLEEYPKEFRGKLVAWYELHNLVSMHQQEAAAEHAKHKAR